MAGYGTDAAFNEWLSSNGYTLPAGAPSPAILRQRGADYVDSAYASRLTCSQPTNGFEQERAWPRTGHMVGTQVIPSGVIPQAWILASYRAAYVEATASGSLAVTVNPGQRIKRQKVDVIEREFFDNGSVGIGSGSSAPVDSIVDGLVASLLCPLTDGTGFMFEAIGS